MFSFGLIVVAVPPGGPLPDLRRLRPLKSWAWGCRGSPASLSTSSLLHLAQAARLMFRNFRTLCSSQHKCSSEFYVFLAAPAQANSQQSCSKYPSPNDFARTGKSTSVTVVPKHLIRGPSVSSFVIPAIDPATVSHHPADQRVIRVQLDTQSRLCCVLQVRIISPRVRLLRSMAPMVAWISTGEGFRSILCLRLAYTSPGG